MKKAIKTTVVAAGIAAAGLAGAGVASADTTAPLAPLADGDYTLSIVQPVAGALSGPLTRVPATVVEDRLYVGPAAVPVTLQPYDDLDRPDGVADGAIVLFNGSTWGQLTR